MDSNGSNPSAIERHKARRAEPLGVDKSDPKRPRLFADEDSNPLTRLSVWLRKPAISRGEAALLLVGLEPGTEWPIYSNRSSLKVSGPLQVADGSWGYIALSGLKVADQNVIDFAWRLQGILPADYMTPAELIRWARENGHDEWVRVGDEYKQPNGDSKQQHSMSIPGKMPRVRIRVLVVQAALEIERETGRVARRDDVMARLQEWADKGKYPDALVCSDKKKKAVKWVTAGGEERSFDRDACTKALWEWNKTR